MSAAQERGEIRKDGERGKAIPNQNSFLDGVETPATYAEAGINAKDVFEGRQIAAAKERGEVAGHGAPKGGRGNQYTSGKLESSQLTTEPTFKDLSGTNYEDVREGRAISAAEKAEPGIVRKTIEIRQVLIDAGLFKGDRLIFARRVFRQPA